jgi:hypothetical protein
MDPTLCAFCGNEVALALEQCPHCGRAGAVPNVKAAEAKAERRALDRRYQAGLRNATQRKCRATLDRFETALAGSKAVINGRVGLLERLASSDRELYSSYYQRLDAEIQAPYGDVWDVLRAKADATLFPLFGKQIRFAALTLDGVGVQSYGECSLVLREDLIAHRASVFEDNSAVFLRDRDYKLPPGCRATWKERPKLCVAKLAASLQVSMDSADFAGVLLHQGKSSEEDRFVEVHVWGSVSIRTFDLVLLNSNESKLRQPARKALMQRLTEMGISMEVH